MVKTNYGSLKLYFVSLFWFPIITHQSHISKHCLNFPWCSFSLPFISYFTVHCKSLIPFDFDFILVVHFVLWILLYGAVLPSILSGSHASGLMCDCSALDTVGLPLVFDWFLVDLILVFFKPPFWVTPFCRLLYGFATLWVLSVVA